MTGCGIMPSVWDMILQCGSTIKVSIELPITTRHSRDMTEKLLKAMFNPNTHTHAHSWLIFEALPVGVREGEVARVYTCSLFPPEINCFISCSPHLRPLFPCSPEINALVPLFPKTPGRTSFSSITHGLSQTESAVLQTSKLCMFFQRIPFYKLH